VSSVFNLHNNRASRELNFFMNGQRLKHDSSPVYLGVTLDRTLSYKDHISKTVDKLKSRNHLISKLTGMTWGANDSTLRTSALALCHSVAEYCCPVWLGLAMPDVLTPKQHYAPTQTAWLPVLANTAPHCKAASDKLMTHIAAHENWPVHAEVFHPPVKRLVSRRPIWTNTAPIDISAQWRDAWESAAVVHQGLVPDPTIRQPGFDLPRRSWALLNRFRTGQGQCHANLFKWRLSVQMWSTPDDDSHCRLMPRIQFGWWSTEAPLCR